MKQVFLASTFLLCLIMLMMIFSTLVSKSYHKNEMEKAMANSMKCSLEEVMKENTYAITEKERFLVAFGQHMIANIGSDMALEFRALETDIEEGCLSLEVIGTYHLNDLQRTEKSVRIRRTIIFEKQ